MKRECKKCNKLKPLDSINFSEYKKKYGKIFTHVCKPCKLIYERTYKAKLLKECAPKVYVERAIIGHKNEPYYIGENDRDNDLKRILNYKTGDQWTEK